MSWYGSHPSMSRAEAVGRLPPAACRRCVYWFRAAAGSAPDAWAFDPGPRCGRCGTDRATVLRQWQLRPLPAPEADSAGGPHGSV